MVEEKKILAYALKNAIEHKGKAQENSVLSSLFHEGLGKDEVKNIMPLIQKTVIQVNSLPLQEQEKSFSALEKETGKREERIGLQELPNAKKGKVVLRLAPFPSGALHIGNARTALLNAMYSEKYNGKLYFMLDDTIGSEKKQLIKEAYKIIPEELNWLKVKYKKPILYKSDRLKIYYKYAEMLIKKGKAYVCSCNAEALRENRKLERECSCRQFPIKEQLKKWKKMLGKKTKEGECTLRIKTSMQDKNPAFRDRVLFRVCEREHPRVGKKYKVWPLLELSWAIDDHLLGITHIVRGKDLMMESEMEKYIWDIFGWKHPELLHNGLMRLEGLGVKISKSKAQQDVKSGKFTGWHDPRTWSITSLRKRGFLPEAIRKFIEDIGLNQKDIVVPIDILYAENRKLLHGKARQAKFKQTTPEEGIGEEKKIEKSKEQQIEEKKIAEESNMQVIMPDGSTIEGSTILEPKKDESIHFVGFGYCKFDGKKKGKMIFYFAHK